MLIPNGLELGGSRDRIGQLLTDPSLDVAPVKKKDKLPFYS